MHQGRPATSAHWAFAFAACAVGAGLASLWIGQDANWDLRNYHYHNAHAFLSGRFGWDIAPAMHGTYHNPLPDLPFYWLANHVPSARAVALVMSLSTAAAAFFFLRILALLFPGKALHIALAALIGLTGATGVSTVSSTMHEWPLAALLLAATWLVLASRRRRLLALAGFLCGIAFGLKLTYGVFALALCVALPARDKWPRWVVGYLLFGGFVLVGFAVSYGFWAWILWRDFGNPFFPYFNTVFQSPYWEIASFHDDRFGPRTFLQALGFPLLFARESRFVSEGSFRDYRLATVYVLAALCLAKALLARERRWDVPWRVLGIFALAAYLIWLPLFAIYRYLLPLEVLSGAFVVGAFAYLLKDVRARYIVLVLIAVLLVGTTRKTGWERVPFTEGAYFKVVPPAVPPDSLVLLASPQPMAYAIPFFPSDTRFVATANGFLAMHQSNVLQREVVRLVASHNGPLYLLEYRLQGAQSDFALRELRLLRERESCAVLHSNIDNDSMRLCRLQRARLAALVPAAMLRTPGD